MNRRKSIRKIILILGILILAYFGFMLIGGGFGKKPLNIREINDDNSQFLFAHRGISAYYPENTREAIEAAKLQGFKGLEIDIRKSSDNEFILFHDEDGGRLLGVDSKIYDLSVAQIKEHRVLFDNVESGSYVLTLKEFLEEFKDDFVIYFDMKLKGWKDVDELVNIIQSDEISRSTIIASTSASVVFHIECKYPDINTALEGFNAGKEWIYYLMPKNFKPDFLSGLASKVNEDHIEWLQKRDLLSIRIVYGVDSTNYQSLVNLGLKNMIVDYYPNLQIQ